MLGIKCTLAKLKKQVKYFVNLENVRHLAYSASTLSTCLAYSASTLSDVVFAVFLLLVDPEQKYSRSLLSRPDGLD